MPRSAINIERDAAILRRLAAGKSPDRAGQDIMTPPDIITAEVEAALVDLDPRSRVTGRHILERIARRAYQYGRDAAIQELLTAEQVAENLGLSVGRVRVLARDRHVGLRIEHNILFRPEDVERLRDRRPGRPRKNGSAPRPPAAG